MSNMLERASSFNQWIGDWSVGSVVIMYQMFGSFGSFAAAVSAAVSRQHGLGWF
jgi:hypothetical protein